MTNKRICLQFLGILKLGNWLYSIILWVSTPKWWSFYLTRLPICNLIIIQAYNLQILSFVRRNPICIFTIRNDDLRMRLVTENSLHLLIWLATLLLSNFLFLFRQQVTNIGTIFSLKFVHKFIVDVLFLIFGGSATRGGLFGWILKFGFAFVRFLMNKKILT